MADWFPEIAGPPQVTGVLAVGLAYRAGAVGSMQSKSYDI